MSRTTTDAAVPGHDRDLHPRAPLPLVAEARAQGQLDRRRRDGARDRRHARPGRPRQLRADRRSGWSPAESSALVGARTVKMTAMPQMVALFNGVGGGAAALIALDEFHRFAGELSTVEATSTALSALIGAISFSGSLVAFAKLQELVSGRPIVFRGQQVVNALIIGTAVVLGVWIAAGGEGPGPDLRAHRRRARVRRDVRAADRRRRHARRDLVAQRVHRACRVGDRLRARTTTC